MTEKNSNRAFTLTGFFIALMLSSSVSGDELSAKAVVEKFQGDLIDVMKNGQVLGFSGRVDKLTGPVSESHDLPGVARIVVGEEWEKLTSDQQQQLIAVFSEFSIASYAHNFTEYTGETFTFNSEEEIARGGMVIHSRLNLPDDKPVKFDYMLKKEDDNWLIVNIIADGVSDLALKRSEYTTILQREGFDSLISKIKGKIVQYSKS
ncbi:MAG: ABC transporter substrate-binding protein [Methylococcales bacterium]